MIQKKPIAFFLLAPCLLAAVAAGSSASPQGTPEGASILSPWSFREDFSQVIPGWVGYPLSQDVGYDPTIYTQKMNGSAVLVRDVISYGERLLRVGMVRSLKFHAGPSSSLHIAYDLETCGRIQSARIMLGANGGRRYSSLLAFQPGAHDVKIEGRQWGIPSAGADVEVIVLEAEVTGSSYGAHTRLTLHTLEIQAERPLRLPVCAPELERSPVTDLAVARELVSADDPLKIDLGPGRAAQIAVYDDAGRRARTENVPAGDARNAQVATPEKPGLYKCEIISPPARTEFNFLVLGKVPAHPRVLLTPERLQQLRSQSYSKDLLAIVHRQASSLRNSLAYNPQAGQNILLLPTFIIHPGQPSYFALMVSYGNAIVYNALDFRLGGDRQALEAARRALLTVSAWPTWTPAWFLAKGIHTYYGVGVFTQEVALGYDLIAEELSAEDKATIAEALWTLSIRPTLDDYFLYDRLPIAASNHEPQSVGGAIDACVALYGDVPDWKTRFGPALAELVVAYERLLEGLFPGDGSEAEPASYAGFAMEGMSWGMAALHALDIRPSGFEKMMKSFLWVRYAQVSPDLVLDTGDFHSELRALPGYAWGAEYSGDATLQRYYETAPEGNLRSVFAGHPAGQTSEEAPGLLDLVCCTHPSGAGADLPPSRIFPARGSAVLRSGWLPQDTVIALRVGPWFNHEHHDQGSFRVAAFGEELISEAGYASYYQDPHFPDFFTQAPAHNTVIIDDDAFSQGDYDGRYWPQFQNFARFASHVFSPGIDYLSAELAPAYNEGAQINRLSREYLFVKPAILIVHDRIEAAAPHSYAWLLHVPPGAQTSLDSAQAFIRRSGAFVALCAAGENTHWTLQPQPIPTIAYRDLDRIPVEPREAYRLESPKTEKSSFLVAMRFQKAGEEPAPLQPHSTASGEGFQASGGAIQILFRSKPGQFTLGDLASDGDVLAISKVNGGEEILSGNVKVLQRGAHTLLSFNRTTDAAIRESADLTEIYLSCSAVTDLRFYPEKAVSEVVVDGTRIDLFQTRGLISINNLTKGDHLVTIRY